MTTVTTRAKSIGKTAEFEQHIDERDADLEYDSTQRFLTDEEADRYRHVNSQYGVAIALGMRHMNVYQGTFHEGRYTKRRTRNKLAKKSRKINRRK